MNDNKFPHITDPQIQAYCNRYSSKPELFFDSIEESTEITGKMIMLSGKFLGKYLQLMSMVIRPKYILELGTFTGYGTLCLSKGLHEDGTIYTIERSDDYSAIARRNLAQHPAHAQVKLLYGDALDLIPTLDVTWDLVFIDANKKQYANYFDLVLPQLRSGGVILADNVLWKGKVGHPENDKLGKALEAFNEKVFADERVENILLPIDDGVNLIVKK